MDNRDLALKILMARDEAVDGVPPLERAPDDMPEDLESRLTEMMLAEMQDTLGWQYGGWLCSWHGLSFKDSLKVALNRAYKQGVEEADRRRVDRDIAMSHAAIGGILTGLLREAESD